MIKPKKSIYIGELAKTSGVSPKAIRHYEELGLLPTPRRRGKYRIYSERDIFLVHIIKKAQSLGFKLAEIKPLLSNQPQNTAFPLTIADKIIEEKQTSLRAEIKKLQQLEHELAEMKIEMHKFFKPKK